MKNGYYGLYYKNGHTNLPLGYWLNIYNDGAWKLLTKADISFEATCYIQTWHKLKLQCNEQNIKAYIGNQLLDVINDISYNLGATFT